MIDAPYVYLLLNLSILRYRAGQYPSCIYEKSPRMADSSTALLEFWFLRFLDFFALVLALTHIHPFSGNDVDDHMSSRCLDSHDDETISCFYGIL